jgi:7-cyano-7-deazaguanine reductase
MKNENLKKEVLECVANPDVNRRYTIEFETSEFTALYAKTGQPIFAHIAIFYVPHKTCLEQMSLKRYLCLFRNERVYYEGVINQMVDDLVVVCDPVGLKVTGRFSVRGGITTAVTVTYGEGDL